MSRSVPRVSRARGESDRTGRVWYSRRQVGDRVATDVSSHSQYRIKQLGQADDLPNMQPDGVTILDYDQACGKAREHAAELARGPKRNELTVRAAVALYLDDLERRQHEDARYQTESKFNRWVLKHPIADAKVNDLQITRLAGWHDPTR
jgi:hypothetical protein